MRQFFPRIDGDQTLEMMLLIGLIVSNFAGEKESHFSMSKSTKRLQALAWTDIESLKMTQEEVDFMIFKLQKNKIKKLRR